MIKGFQEDVIKSYDKIRENEKSLLKKRKEEILLNYPEIIKIQNDIGKYSIELSINTLRQLPNRQSYIDELKEKITNLRIKKAELLVKYGFTPDYLELHYNCVKCKDTGFIGHTKCICFYKKLVDIYYENSSLKNILKGNNFDNFNISYYSPHRIGSEPDSPKTNMEIILKKSLDFIKNFNTTNENLLFYGNSGTGKTFLSHCIAKELLDKSHFVVYKTSQDLIEDLRSARFKNNYDLEKLLIDCDLLIIDDLGTEQINIFSKTELFNLLNRKLLKNKKMIISTNYTLEGLLQTYSERITSRLLGNFTLFKFYGDDIRVKKNLDKIK